MAANGVDPNQPQNVLDVPEPAVLVKVLDTWEQQRKAAQVLLVMDVSGSMAEPAAEGSDVTKLELAATPPSPRSTSSRTRTRWACASSPPTSATRPARPRSTWCPWPRWTKASGPACGTRSRACSPRTARPLYQATQEAAETIRDTYDPTLINAVVLLTDGVNDDGNQGDDANQLDELIHTLRGGEGANAKAVRVFPIAYGGDADTATLRRIAEASNGAALRGQQPGHHQRGLHRRRVQLLTRVQVAPSARDQPIVSIG